MVQAVNRIQTRRVIDTAGNCPASFVYLLLPDDGTGKAVFKAVMEHMPGIQRMKWSFNGAKQVPRGKHEKSLQEFIGGLVGGESWSASELKKYLSIPKSTWGELVVKMKDDTSALKQLMEDQGVIFEVQGGGRSIRSTLRRL